MFYAQPNEMRRVSQAVWLLAIVVISAAAGMVCVWLAPGLDRYARDYADARARAAAAAC